MWLRCVPVTLTGKPAVDKSANSGDVVGDVLISLTGINLVFSFHCHYETSKIKIMWHMQMHAYSNNKVLCLPHFLD